MIRAIEWCQAKSMHKQQVYVLGSMEMEQGETLIKLYKCSSQHEEVMSMNEGMSIGAAMRVQRAESVHMKCEQSDTVHKWKRGHETMSVCQETRGEWEWSNELK